MKPFKPCHSLAAAVALVSLMPLANAEQFTWNNSAGGDYANGANWTGTVSPAGTVPGDTDTVLFNRASAGYTVNVTDNIDQASLTIGNDHVTFNMDAALYGAAASIPLQVGTGSSSKIAVFVVQSNSTSASADPSFFNTNNAIIGNSTGAKGQVTAGNVNGALFWNNDGNLLIGGSNGAGTGSLLAINAGASVSTDGILRVFAGSTLNLNGGSLSMGTFDRHTGGSSFLWSTGVLQITASSVTIDSTGLFGNAATLITGQELDAQQGLTIAAGGNLSLSGGTLSASTLVNNGAFSFSSGTLAITGNDVSIGATGLFGASSTLATGKALIVTSNTTINTGTTLQLSGGMLSTGALVIQTGAALAFTAGTLQLTNSDLIIDTGGLLGSSVTLNASRNVIVAPPIITPPNGVTSINPGANLLLAGGSFSTGSLSLNGGTFAFTSGTLSLTASNVIIDAGGMLTTSSTFNAGRNLVVAAATFINPGGTLTVSGGSLFTGALISNGGTLNFTSGTLGFTADEFHIAPGEILGGTLSINAGMTLETDSSSALDIDDGGLVTLNGGTVNANQINLTGSGHIVFNTGTLNLTAGIFLVDPAGPLGGNITLGFRQTVIAAVASTITSGNHLTINGGRFSTGTLATTANFTFTAGEFDLTASGLTISSTGLLGNSVTIDPSKTLFTGSASTISSGASLFITGGTFIASGLTNSGTFSFTAGTLHITHDPVVIGSSGLFGDVAQISSTKTLIADTSLTLQNSQTLTITGGNVQTPILNAGLNSSGAILQSGGGATVAATLNLGAASTGSYALSGTGLLAAATLQLVNGTFTQSGGTANVTTLSLSSHAGNLFTVSSGTFTAASTLNASSITQTGGLLNLGHVTGTGSISASGSAHATADSIRQASISITENALLSLNPTTGNNSTSAISGISVGGNGKLDLNNTSMAFYSSDSGKSADYNLLLAQVITGRASGAWSGNGISSSAAQLAYAAHQNQEFTALAVVRNDQLQTPMSTFQGVPVDLDSILIRYTYVGDANLDGVLSIDDYIVLDRGFLLHLTGWQNGDFNNDGVINFSDYAAIDRVFLQQGGPLAEDLFAQHAQEFGAPYLAALGVPEPASLSVLCLGTLVLLRCKFRRKLRGRQQ